MKIVQFKSIVFLFLLSQSFLFSQEKTNQVDENGNKNGQWKGYYDDSKNLKYEGQFENGKEIGIFTFYDNIKSKKIVATRDFSANDGSSYTIIYNGKFKVSEGKVIDKIHEGEWKFYHLRSDTLMTLENYKKGALHGVKKVFYNTGLLAELTTFENGIKDGPYQKVAENGVVMEESIFKNGAYDGTAIFREAAGDNYTKGQFKNGKSIGKWYFYKNGKVVKTENRSEHKRARPQTKKVRSKEKLKN
jgi:antitoxin component YwqK of YwqJK toxin-antitoxin module